MRVISGKFKCKRLFSPDDNRIRPTADRIKETIFNIVASKFVIEDASVLDLFCGAGALGIEALSRGARTAIFADNHPESVALTKKNLQHVGAERTAYEVYKADYRVALEKLKDRGFQLIFADPPYAAGIEGDILRLICQGGILSADGVLILEHDSHTALNTDGWSLIETRKMGGTSVSFLKLS